jgi:hypothetical protein
LASTLLTRIAACWRAGQLYVVRDTDRGVDEFTGALKPKFTRKSSDRTREIGLEQPKRCNSGNKPVEVMGRYWNPSDAKIPPQPACAGKLSKVTA